MSPVRQTDPVTRGRRWDVAGGLLWGALLLWVVAREGPVPAAGLILVAAAGYTLARVAGARAGVVPFVAGGGIAAGVAVVLLAGTWRGPDAGLLGYANATAALAVQGAAVAGLAVAARQRRVRGLAVAGALLLAAAPWIIRSQAGEAAGLLVVGAVVLSLAHQRRADREPLVLAAVAAGLLLVATAAQMWIGQRFGGPGADPAVPPWMEELSVRRADLWHDATQIVAAHPLTGAGAGAFARLSPTAADPDTPLAHSLLLQVAAEHGWVGAALLTGGMVWAVARTAAAPAAGATTVAVAAWVGFQAQAGIDYVASFWPVVLVAAAVQGLATGAGARSTIGLRPRSASSGCGVSARGM